MQKAKIAVEFNFFQRRTRVLRDFNSFPPKHPVHAADEALILLAVYRLLAGTSKYTAKGSSSSANEEANSSNYLTKIKLVYQEIVYPESPSLPSNFFFRSLSATYLFYQLFISSTKI